MEERKTGRLGLVYENYYDSSVKNLPVMQETPLGFLGWEDPLQKGKATHYSILGLPLWLSW